MISSNFIRDYAYSHWPEGRLQSDGDEYTIPSIYSDNDYKRHMSINLTTGLWQCFKTKNRGNFTKLYALEEGISFQSAYSKLIFESVVTGHAWDDEAICHVSVPIRASGANISLEGFEPISPDSDPNDPVVLAALRVLYERKIFPQEDGEYYIAREGKYKGRLIIPYKDELGEVYFFQGRALLEDQEPKYLNPGREEGVRSSNILYPFDDDLEKNSHLYVTEGPTDAKTLERCGFNTTCVNGSHVSQAQAEQLRESGLHIVIAFDNDAAGHDGLKKFSEDRKFSMISRISSVFPPKGLDWNGFYVKDGLNMVIDHITYNYKDVDDFSDLRSKLEEIL